MIAARKVVLATDDVDLADEAPAEYGIDASSALASMRAASRASPTKASTAVTTALRTRLPHCAIAAQPTTQVACNVAPVKMTRVLQRLAFERVRE